MLYELVVNSTHRNNVALYRCWDYRNAFYKKIALTEEANARIDNEQKGYEWFSNATGMNCSTRLVKGCLHEIDIREFHGRKFALNSTIIRNEDTIHRIIDFYKRTWLTADHFAIHGDLALSNCIINRKREIYLVDWEHFHLGEKACFGFDIFNMLFIALSNQSRRIGYIGRRTKGFLRECYGELESAMDSSNELLDRPFCNSRNYLRQYRKRFKVNVDIGEKFILAGYPKPELEKLDVMITGF